MFRQRAAAMWKRFLGLAVGRTPLAPAPAMMVRASLSMSSTSAARRPRFSQDAAEVVDTVDGHAGLEQRRRGAAD